MSFNSGEFLVFLIVVLICYLIVFRWDLLRNSMLLVASYVFYMSWNWKYSALIAISTLVDYSVGLMMSRSESTGGRKGLLITSLAVNLGLLGVFKYYNFFMDIGQEAAGCLGLSLSFPHHQLLLPVGISFYTFQTLSYTIDVYRRRIPAEKDILKFSLYVSFFPQLVAGPIVRASHFLPQLRNRPDMRREGFERGLCLVFQGLFKKIVIADLLADLGVDAVFADPAGFSSWDLLFALYGYTFQIYNDFSGYSDIAIGVARMLGFEIPENFRRPYLSQGLREFWRRWHISLSSWLRDYLYIPLGGNKTSRGGVWVNLMITMLLGGLWHGASANFVLWGAYHGVLLIVGRSKAKGDGSVTWFNRVKRQFVCFQLVAFGWLIFRIGSMDHLAEYLQGLTQLSVGTAFHPVFYGILGLGVTCHILPKKVFESARRVFIAQPLLVQATVYSMLLLIFSGMTIGGPKFIYFQF